MTRPAIALLAALTALAIGLAACQDPYQPNPPRRTPTAAVRAGDVDRPGPSAPAPVVRPPARVGSARAVAVAFAFAWSNWDWRTAARQQRALARLAVGELAAQLRANADATAADSSLARDRPGSRGRVIAIDVRQHRQRASAVIVTREQTFTAGHADLGGQHHRVYRATLTHSAHGWGVSAWTPLP